jgi:hypothetical protein
MTPPSSVDEPLPKGGVGERGLVEPAWRDLRPDRFGSQVLYRAASLRLDGTRADAARQGRLLATAALADWRLWPVQSDAVLCVSELVGNAKRHAVRPVIGSADDRRVSVGLWCRSGELLLGVGDYDAHMPRLPVEGDDPSLMDEGGRGLRMVAALSDGLFCKRAAHGGKVVLCRFVLARYGLRPCAVGGAA